MKIGIISHSPLWTTGFGVTCSCIANALSNACHDVYCFCLGEDELPEKTSSFKIYNANWSKAYADLSAFLKQETPDTLIINFDINAVGYFIKFCKLLSWRGDIFAHIVMDGFPVYDDLLQTIKNINGIIVPTKASRKYLQSEGIKNVYYAPHGVDIKKFMPLPNKENIRRKLGLKNKVEKRFIIGVFAKNEERKQIPKVLLALHYLIFSLKQKNILLYLHTQAKPDLKKGWDLEFIVNKLNLNKYVIFTSKSFRQDKGVDRNFDPSIQTATKQLSYVERLNMCDLIVNIPFSGGFELGNIEAQACGVPLITIDDNGNIKEVVGESACLIKPAMKNIWGNGAWIYLVDEIDLASKILQFKNDTALQISIRQMGLENARKFSWVKLEKTVQKMVVSEAEFSEAQSNY